MCDTMIPIERIQMNLSECEKTMFEFERNISCLKKPTYLSCKRIQINCCEQNKYEKITLRKRIIVENNPFIPTNVLVIGKQRYNIRQAKFTSSSYEYIKNSFANQQMVKLHPLLYALQDIIGKTILEKQLTNNQLIKVFNGIDL